MVNLYRRARDSDVTTGAVTAANTTSQWVITASTTATTATTATTTNTITIPCGHDATGWDVHDGTTGYIDRDGWILHENPNYATGGPPRIWVRDGVTWQGDILIPSEASKQEKLRHKIRCQMQPDLRKLFGHLPRAAQMGADFSNAKQNELVALGLLRSMVAPEVFRKFLKSGFVTVEGPSGLVYQVLRRSHLIYVWEEGTRVASLCVYLQDHNIPPTDEVVAKMLICECDEADIWKRANVSYYKNGIRPDRARALGAKARQIEDVFTPRHDFLRVAA